MDGRMGDLRMLGIELCDREMAEAMEHECAPGEAVGIIRWWIDWGVERVLIDEMSSSLSVDGVDLD